MTGPAPDRVHDGLASSVWTRDHGTAMRMSRALDAGVVWINTHLPYVSEMPHGGFEHSGYGKDRSVHGFEDRTRVEHVMSFTGRGWRTPTGLLCEGLGGARG